MRGGLRYNKCFAFSERLFAVAIRTAGVVENNDCCCGSPLSHSAIHLFAYSGRSVIEVFGSGNVVDSFLPVVLNLSKVPAGSPLMGPSVKTAASMSRIESLFSE